MDLITVSCNQCAAPLEVSATSRFVTCSICQSRLEVHRSESAVFTEVLDQLNQRTEAIGRDVSVIRKQDELAQLDREWDETRKNKFARFDSESTGETRLRRFVATVHRLGLRFSRPHEDSLCICILLVVVRCVRRIASDRYRREASAI